MPFINKSANKKPNHKKPTSSFSQSKKQRKKAILTMIYLFYSVLAIEMSTILLLLFKTPLRKLLIIGLDRAKRGRAPLVVKSVGATVFIIMMYNVYSVTEIQSRPVEAVVNPTDQIILAYHMLEASLM
ncbi:B-cell receptor-associated protein 31-like protein, partial [Tanacetum coccineum]